MGLYDVYTLMDVEPAEARGLWITGADGSRYLDFYGGHAVISIGHSHPHYVERISTQLSRIGFYSNAVQNPLQSELAQLLGEVSGYPDYNLFLCNSGAEANENALKVASFVTGRDRVVAMRGAFHGRTSAAVAVTDNPTIQAPVNCGHKVSFVPLGDLKALEKEVAVGDVAAVMIEGIQGVGGIRVASDEYLLGARALCDKYGSMLLLDEVQSGYGRSGKFFAHQYSGVKPDIISMAKGMGNGFPVAGILIAPHIEARKGMLGTTFGGSHLACSATLAVLEVIRDEELVKNAAEKGEYLISAIRQMDGISEVRGRGLMIGVELPVPQGAFRKQLLADYGIMTGYSGTNTLRLLPPLCVTTEECDMLLSALKNTLSKF